MEKKPADEGAQNPSAEILSLNQEILRTNKEILESLNYIKNHFRFQMIITAVKWFFFAALIIFGFISLSTILSGLGESYLGALSGK